MRVREISLKAATRIQLGESVKVREAIVVALVRVLNTRAW